MREITVVSGKGGTGKTSITAALASVAEQTVFCDNDVDAADLHLIFQPDIKEKHFFSSGFKAVLDADKCSSCGKCHEYCRFGAIHSDGAHNYYINQFQCEGCRLCERLCPENAIHSIEQANNFWFISDSRFGKLVHAEMGPGEENSGKLVSLVRKQAKLLAKEHSLKFILNDGPPGIGCSAISSLSGSDAALIVIEPTKSGLHDAIRLVELIEAFNVELFAVINKFDINLNLTATIEEFLNVKKILLLAKLPFDKAMVEAMNAGKTIVEFSPESELSSQIRNVWEVLIQR